mmetsp:Transcript_31062/g.47055  ORF Transcript_31062/g.47055 Transcript_31062/m.47055 type:complete len:173 (-) Transcript_31062:101-619(-)
MTEDREVQRKGIVLVLYNSGGFSIDHHFNRFIDNFVGEIIQKAFPCYVAGVHLCFDSKVYELILPFVLYSFGQDIRSRTRLHTDTYSLGDALEECGIPKDNTPLQTGGNFEIDLNSWKQERERIEKLNTATCFDSGIPLSLSYESSRSVNTLLKNFSLASPVSLPPRSLHNR